MRRVFRYEVPVGGVHTVQLNADAKPLSVVALSDSGPAEFWAEDNDQLPTTGRAFTVLRTGDPIPGTAAWAGTCPRTKHGYVWHLYEIC